MTIEYIIKKKFEEVVSSLDEKQRRLWVANEAIKLGYGGIATVCRATGVTRLTIKAGMKELEQQHSSLMGVKNIRLIGGGRKRKVDVQPELIRQISELAKTFRSSRAISTELKKRGVDVSYNIVAGVLKRVRQEVGIPSL